MHLRIFTEPQQGAHHETLLAVARETERLGFDAFFRSDHYLKMGKGSGLPGPSDAWLTLAALARETSRIRLGTLVTAMTFRLPGPLAISVAQVDEMSGGRVELGIGTGWYEQEHTAYGIPFPPLGERFERLGEQLEIITGLWETALNQEFNFNGKHYQLANSPALPKPTQGPRPPIIIGGSGPKRTPNLAARFADEFNQPFTPLSNYSHQRDRVNVACEAIERDPASLLHSAALVVCCGENEESFAHRASRIGREPEELRENGAAGTPDEVLAKLRAYADAGAQRFYLQVLDLEDLEHLGLIAETVLPEVSSW